MSRTFHRISLRSCSRIALSSALALAVALVAVALALTSPSPAAALTPGQASVGYPRLAHWWGGAGPLAESARRDYYVPSDVDALHPNTAQIATLRALNPTIILLASSSACELNYSKDNNRAYDAEQIGAIPTSWLLLQVGSTLSAPVTSTSATTISVADVSKFRVNDLIVIDNEKCVVTGVGSTLTVSRGFAGSTAATHASGTRVAAVVSGWAYAVTLDMTAACPLGRATGTFATPGSGSERASDWFARRTAGITTAANWDGVLIDVSMADYAASYLGSPYCRTIANRAALSTETDYAAFDRAWQVGIENYLNQVRTRVGNDSIIVPNAAPPVFETVNGATFEGFPTATTTSQKWHENIAGPTRSASQGAYLEWNANVTNPNAATVITYGSTTDYRLVRFGLCTALMGDGYFAYEASGTGHSITGRWYDEYDNAGAGKGFLGAPIGTASKQVSALSSPDLLGGYGGFANQSALSAWQLYPRTGYAASGVLDGGAAKISVTQSAGAFRGVSISRPSIALAAGKTYTLSFRARADRSLPLQALLQQANSPYSVHAIAEQVPLTTEWRTFELPLTTSAADSAANLILNMGTSVGTIWIDDIKVQAGDRSVYRRDYEGGVALVNATDAAVTVALGGSFRKINGTQAPQVNDGSLVTAVTIPAKDGLVLLRTASTPPTPPTPPTPDTAPPITTDDHVATYSGTATIRLTASDAGSGVAGTTWTLDDASGSGTTVTTSIIGSHTLTYRSTDVSGNLEADHTVAFTVVVPTTPTKKPPVYRFYNRKNGTHFYTASTSERDSVLNKLSVTYTLDGAAYTINTDNPANSAPLYRFFNKSNGSHFYTASEAEKNAIVANMSATYTLDGPAYSVCLSPVSGATTVYRFFNKSNGSHFYTASEAEKDSVLANLSATYTLDGPAFYVAP